MTMTRFTGETVRVAAMAALTFTMATTVAAQVPAQVPASDGPDVTVTRLAGARVLIEVAEAGVSVRKEIAADASHATITTAKDELHLRVLRGQMTVSSPGGTVTIRGGGADEVAQLMAVLQRSDAAVKGLALLKRVPANTRDFGRHSLLLTRAILELGTGPSDAISLHRRGVAEDRARRLTARPVGATVTRVALQEGTQDRGPGQCWDMYAAEAIRIADDFLDCTADLRWYDALGWAGCSLIYTVRSEAAMFWLVSCSGGFPFSG